MNQASRMYAEHQGRKYRVGFVYDDDCTILSRHMAKLLGPGSLRLGKEARSGKPVDVRPTKARMIACYVYDITDRTAGDPDPTTGLAPGVTIAGTGRSFCLPIDEYHREDGRRLALHRAVEKFPRELRRAVCGAYEQRRTSPVINRRYGVACRNLLEGLVEAIERADRQYHADTSVAGTSAVAALGGFHATILAASRGARDFVGKRRARRARTAA